MHCHSEIGPRDGRVAQLKATKENMDAALLYLRPGYKLTPYQDESTKESMIDVFLCKNCRELVDLEDGKETESERAQSLCRQQALDQKSKENPGEEVEEDEMQAAIEASLQDFSSHRSDGDEEDKLLMAAIEASLADTLPEDI